MVNRQTSCRFILLLQNSLKYSCDIEEFKNVSIQGGEYLSNGFDI